MDLSLLNPYIRYARLHRMHPANNMKYSVCYDCRLFFIQSSDGFVIADDKKYEFAPRTVLYFPPKTRYRFKFTDSEKIEIIVMDFDLTSDCAHIKAPLGTATEDTFEPDKVPVYPVPEVLSQPIVKSLPQIHTALMRCIENFLLRESFYRENSSALLKLCLLELIQQKDHKGTYFSLCENVLAYIYENHAISTLTNADIAENFNYHPYHLNHILKQETGKSIHQHLVYTRLNIAKNHLLTTSDSIEEISWKSGFGSTSHFIKLFKEYFGITPKKYRQLRFHTEL